MTVLLILFISGGAILIAIGVPLIQGRVGPNRLYGFRVRQTLENPSIWYPANAYSGRRLLGVGVAEIVAASALYFVPNIDVALYGSLVGGVVLAGLIVGLAQSMRYLHKLTNRIGTGDRDC